MSYPDLGVNPLEKLKKAALLAIKIGIGSSIAICVAQALDLKYAVSAGTVTLLTLMTSKWDTFRLSLFRFVTFTVTVLLGWGVFTLTHISWAAYGLLLMLVVFLAESMGWRATISVNSVVVAHLVSDQNFTAPAIWNELQLVIIGVIIAILLNLFHANSSHQRQIISNMRDTEWRLQTILDRMAAYLAGGQMDQALWTDILALESLIQAHILSASEYQDNTFQSHPEYYISYFEMRYEQSRILHNLYDQLTKIHAIPKQAQMISDYLYYLSGYVREFNPPEKQIGRLDQIFADMRNEELPKTQEEFESRAVLYYLLMDIREFLRCKAEFVDQLDDKQRKLYWGKDRRPTPPT